MTRQIIGFTGKIGSGKSAAAKELHRLGFTRTRFAGALKQMMAVLGLTEDEIEGHLKEVPCALLGGKTPRLAMQTIGTEWGRDIIHPDLWINVWKNQVKKIPAHVSVTVEDVRFANEAEALRSVGGILVRIARPIAAAPSGGKFVVHSSEDMNFPVDLTLRNYYSLDDFLAQVRRLRDMTFTPEGEPFIPDAA